MSANIPRKRQTQSRADGPQTEKRSRHVSPKPTPTARQTIEFVSSGWTCVRFVDDPVSEEHVENQEDYEEDYEQDEVPDYILPKVDASIEAVKDLLRVGALFSPNQEKMIAIWMKVNNTRTIMSAKDKFEQLLKDLGFGNPMLSKEESSKLRRKVTVKLHTISASMQRSGALIVGPDKEMRFARWTRCFLSESWDGSYKQPLSSILLPESVSQASERTTISPSPSDPQNVHNELTTLSSEKFVVEGLDTDNLQEMAIDLEDKRPTRASTSDGTISQEHVTARSQTAMVEYRGATRTQQATVEEGYVVNGSHYSDSEETVAAATIPKNPSPTAKPHLGFSQTPAPTSSSNVNGTPISSPPVTMDVRVPYATIPITMSTYRMWKDQLRGILLTQGVWGVISGTTVAPTPPFEPLQHAAPTGHLYDVQMTKYEGEMRVYQQKADLALGWMLATMGEKKRSELSSHTDPRVVWNVLRDRFLARTL